MSDRFEKYHSVIEGKLLVIADHCDIPYDFHNWRECCNFLIEKCYNLKHAMTLVERDEEHIEMMCPYTAEDLVILGSKQDLEQINNMFILQGLYRRHKHS